MHVMANTLENNSFSFTGPKGWIPIEKMRETNRLCDWNHIWFLQVQADYWPQHRLWSNCMLWSPSRVKGAFIFLSKLLFCKHILWCCSRQDWHICYCNQKFYWNNRIPCPSRSHSMTGIYFSKDRIKHLLRVELPTQTKYKLFPK